jgi:hypothetical protein
MDATEILKTRVTPDIKGRVAQTAREELLTEAVWLRRLVARALHEQGSAVRSPEVEKLKSHAGGAARGQCPDNRGRVARLYVRLPREDYLLLHERAAARSTAAATYVSVLVRAHLRAIVPLPREELECLKRAVAELGAVGRNLNQIARAANQGTRIAGLGRDEFRAILKICEALRDHTKDLIKTNAASWTSGYAESAS